MRLRVRSLALLSGLGIQRGRELWCGLQMRLGSRVAVALVQAGGYSSDSTPAWEPPYAMGAAQRNSKKTKKINNKVFFITNLCFVLRIFTRNCVPKEYSFQLSLLSL